MKKNIRALIAGCFLVSQGWAATLYVDVDSPNPVSPYTSWATAATDIQAAVNVAVSNDTVLVTNGVYLLSSQIAVYEDIILKSVNGADVTTINGGGVTSCIYLWDVSCAVRGFTITGGYSANGGGGVYSHHAGTGQVIENCTITGNTARYGAGLAYGAARNCVISGNSAVEYGGGAYETVLNNCVVSGNVAADYAGGLSGGTANNCTIVGNEGGTYSTTLNNCIVWFNEGQNIEQGSSHNSCSPSSPYFQQGVYNDVSEVAVVR